MAPAPTDGGARRVEFFFDIGSPAAYLAATQLPRLCGECDAELVWRPMLLGGVFQATNNRSPSEVLSKGPYMREDLGRFARRYGVPYVHNTHFPVNTLLLMRGATALQMHRPERFGAYVEAMFSAMWVEGLDLNDADVVAGALARAGFDPDELVGMAGASEVKERLKQQTQAAVARGVFGAPTMIVGEQLFWGQDRLDFVREALEA
ncbi:MAG: 2-hydroxychromene-2-carboxylate isomerase [Comamonadaceae bacterium]|nr:MAG: 2-hydroxychromene-2-carboxylate isomerase [Comamonadaceae bacterium]